MIATKRGSRTGIASLLAVWGKIRETASRQSVGEIGRRGTGGPHEMIIAGIFLVSCVTGANGQVTRLIEGFEFAMNDATATAGVTDLTDFENRPTFYTNGADPGEGGATEGEFSLGTDGLFGGEEGIFVPGSVLGFRRDIDPMLFENGVVPLFHSYGDPDVVGATPADKPLNELEIV